MGEVLTAGRPKYCLPRGIIKKKVGGLPEAEQPMGDMTSQAPADDKLGGSGLLGTGRCGTWDSKASS